MNISIKKIVGIYIFLIYILISYIIASTIEPNIKVMGIIGLGMLIMSIIVWSYMTNEIISAYMFFLFIAYIFLFGQSLLIPFNLINPERNILNLKFVNEVNLYKAQIYTLLCLASLHLGALIFYKKETRILKHNYLIRKVSDKSMINAGVILLLISTIPYFLKMYQSIRIVWAYGYKGMYSQVETLTSIGSLSNKLSSYFILGLICLLVGFRKKIIARRIIYFVSFMIIGLTFYIGSRNNGVIFLLVILLVHHYFVRKITFKKSYKYVIIGILLLVILSSIADSRGIQNRNLLYYIENITENGLSISIITDVFSELGWTMTPTAVIINFVEGGEPLMNGKTYAYSILSLIPNLGFWDIHPAAEITSLGSQLQHKLGISYGPGFSLVAESFLNFAWWGWITFLFLGGFFVRILSLLNRYTAKYYPAIGLSVLLFFNESLFTIRDTFLGNIRAVFYYAIPIYILVVVIDNNYRKKRNRKKAVNNQ